MPIMSQAVYMGQEAAGSFTAGQLNSGGADTRSLLALLALCLLEAAQGGLRHPQQLALPAVVLAALLLSLLRPVAYRRRRQAIVAGVRILCAVKLLLAPEPFHLFNDPALHPVHTSLAKAAAHFMLLVAWETNSLLLLQVRRRAVLHEGACARRAGGPLRLVPAAAPA